MEETFDNHEKGLLVNHHFFLSSFKRKKIFGKIFFVNWSFLKNFLWNFWKRKLSADFFFNWRKINLSLTRIFMDLFNFQIWFLKLSHIFYLFIWAFKKKKKLIVPPWKSRRKSLKLKIFRMWALINVSSSKEMRKKKKMNFNRYLFWSFSLKLEKVF